MAQIADLLDILARPERVTAIIAAELTALKQEFGQTKTGARRSGSSTTRWTSAPGPDHADRHGRRSATPATSKSQPLAGTARSAAAGASKRSGRPRRRWIDDLFIANARLDPVLHQPRPRLLAQGLGGGAAGRAGEPAQPIVNMFPLQQGEKGQRRAAADPTASAASVGPYVFMATAQGTVKDGARRFNNPRKAGIIAVDLDPGDYLISARLTDGHHDVMLFSDGGKAVRFDEDVRPMGNARGVRGMALRGRTGVIAMLVARRGPTAQSPVAAHRRERLRQARRS